MNAQIARVAADGNTVERLAAATRRHGLGELAERLSGLWHWLAADLAALEGALAEVGAGRRDLGWRSARYLLERPGKRIRPVCLALAARAGGRGLDPEVRDAAVAAELVHAATLLHDDVIDAGTDRRGAPPARLVYGNSASVLGGDHLLVEALRRVPGESGAELLEVVSEMVAAEALQLERRRRFEPDRDVYLEVVSGKTAALFRWALRAGARLGGLDRAQIDALGRYGDALGMAFQLVDDVLDLDGDPAVTGKNAGADLREGKLTWPLLHAAGADPDVAARLRVLAAADEDPDPRVAARLIEDVRATGAFAATRAEAERYAGVARGALEVAVAGRVRDALEVVLDAALGREA